ncbi:Glycerophosphoryl diester phosphodiesterase [Lachnospiraceae bacterium XBB2008]|nr:Glycerophosphoryl diester phosphodiesterase [Lachnospiraceae bacterium XBB2008]
MHRYIYVSAGTKLVPNTEKAYLYKFHVLTRPGQYIYSYDYESEEKWITRATEYEPSEPLTGEFEFTADRLPASGEGYITITDAETGLPLPEASYSIIPLGFDTWEEAERASVRAKVAAFMSREDVRDEVERTAKTICEKAGKASSDSGSASGKLVFTLLADTHYVLNGNWEYTAETIKAVHESVRKACGSDIYTGIIHLGDLTDGILSKDICRIYSGRVLDELKSLNLPLYMVAGNHDSNYFRKNPDILTEEEQYDLYMSHLAAYDAPGSYISAAPKSLYYRYDIPGSILTLLVLSAYDNYEQHRYGYTEEQLTWISAELDRFSDDRRVLVLSHDAPLTNLDFWAKEIRNGEALCDILDAWNVAHDHRLIGFLHGHTHADLIYTKRSFPIISVGCSKIEYFEDKKPDGAICPARIEGEVTQELWDTLILDPETGDMDFIRFGAGIDRHVIGHTIPSPKVWAHRGASGYLPENTLEAFNLAADMGADGIELDVQFTRDRQLVVIHDERIERTSDGQGAVADMTLYQLRQYNYNRTIPDDTQYDIPTLSEVLELIRPNGMIINIELKTGVNFYPGIEQATVDLVRKYGMEDRVIYSSFNHESLIRLKEYAPDAECGVLYSTGIADPASYAKVLGMQAIHPSVGCVKYPGLPEHCKDNGIRMHVWTVNSEAQMEQMRQLGVDAIITNYPDVALALYGRDHKSYEELKPTPTADIAESEQDSPVETVAPSQNTGHKHPWPLRIAGTMYKYIRKPFVALDRVIQKAAGK